MESQEGPSAISLFVYFSIASCLLYLGAVVGFVSPGGYRESLFERLLPLLIATLPALLLTLRIAGFCADPSRRNRRQEAF